MNTIQTTCDIQPTIGSLVAKDYRTAAVFKKYGIDFCCNGNRSIEAACGQDPAKTMAVKADLKSVTDRSKTSDGAGIDFGAWPLDLLADYVEKKHHRYVAAQIPVLESYLEKLCKVHGSKHPELFQIKDLFAGCSAELSAHMKKEEEILFPFIRKMAAVSGGASGVPSASFGTVQQPIGKMMQEHEAEGARFREIVLLTDNYTAPADGCGTYRVTFALLQEFEADLHLHIHLENNILFPKSIAFEAQLNEHEAQPAH